MTQQRMFDIIVIYFVAPVFPLFCIY